MSPYEAIERLNAITRMQADIIQKQAEALAQAEIADQVAAELAEMRATAAAERALVEKEYN